MKLTDYVMDYLAAKGSRHVFGMSGGAAVHLFDSAARHPLIGTTFVTHEQSAAMAADGYYRLSGNLGACAVTSGPGATNLLTGTCCSYYDSVPALLLTGQVATHRLKGERKVRQIGFQETDVLSIFSSVTKYAEQLRDPAQIACLLDRAYAEAENGRPGPVLIDIPDDLQRARIDPASLPHIVPSNAPPDVGLRNRAASLLQRISGAKQPVIVIGGGFSTPRKADELRQFLRRIEVPVLQTWAGLDVLPFDWPQRCGTFGVYGPRLGNFVVQHADLLVCLGTRLSQNLTGGMLETFAPRAHIAMVDVDQGELDKFDGRGIRVAERICARLDHFLEAANAYLDEYRPPEISSWLSTIEHWRRSLPTDIPPRPADSAGHVDAIHFVGELSSVLADDEAIFVDTGGNLTWTCNNLRVKAGQRVLSAWNFTPMGYALPAAIGGASAGTGRPITCITGDGGLQLCLGELATAVRYDLPLKILLFNNHAHGIQKQTLETWLEARYVGVDPASGLGLSDFAAVARAMGIPVFNIAKSSEIARALREAYKTRGLVLCNVEINPQQKLHPVLKYGSSLENQMPLMPTEQVDSLRVRQRPGV